MSKEVAVKGANLPSKEFKNMFDSSLGMGAGENIDSEDILIPKIHLAQALTPEVVAKELEAGVYMNSIEKTEIGPDVDIYVMSSVKLLQVYYLIRTKNKVTKEYLGTVNHTEDEYTRIGQGVCPADLVERLEAKGIKADGVELQADKVLRFYCVRTGEVAAGIAFPYIIDFKRTSYGAGRELQTKFAQLRSMGLPSYAKAFTIGSHLVQGEHDYFVKVVKTGRDITQEEVAQVESWVRELQANSEKYVADETDTKEDAVVKDVSPEATKTKKPKF